LLEAQYLSRSTRPWPAPRADVIERGPGPCPGRVVRRVHCIALVTCSCIQPGSAPADSEAPRRVVATAPRFRNAVFANATERPQLSEMLRRMHSSLPGRRPSNAATQQMAGSPGDSTLSVACSSLTHQRRLPPSPPWPCDKLLFHDLRPVTPKENRSAPIASRRISRAE